MGVHCGSGHCLVRPTPLQTIGHCYEPHPLRLLVTVMNYGTVGDLKKAIITTVTNCTVLCDLLLVAEVKDGVILRVMV